jgi:hypothetical protein
MKPIDQHMAIALALGYTFEDKELTYDGMPIKFRVWKTPDGGGMERDWPPNYPEDLNACHEMEKILNQEQREEYLLMLQRVVEDISHDQYLHWSDNAGSTTSATAAQRSQAFLRTLSLWKE